MTKKNTKYVRAQIGQLFRPGGRGKYLFNAGAELEVSVI